MRPPSAWLTQRRLAPLWVALLLPQAAAEQALARRGADQHAGGAACPARVTRGCV